MADAPDHSWLGRYPVLAADDHAGLDAAAAIHEFRHRIPQDGAEQRAHAEYLKDRALDAAAHHYVGVKAAHHSGHDAAAAMHGAAYVAACQAAGEDPYGPAPQAVVDRLRTQKPLLYHFKAHPADAMINPPEAKPEGADVAKSLLDSVAELRARLAG